MIRPAVRHLTFLLLASSALIPAAAQAQDLPTGGNVARGAATIGAPAGGAMTIAQSSDRAVINWQSFSIGEGGRVDIRQPDARSVLLNRVTGDTTSTIAGSLGANGQVFLINPNGIQITATGAVRAAGFVASTLDIGDDDFMQGDIVVTGRGGRVSNAGTISIVSGGYAALIGGQVDNSGFIHAPLGRVMLGAGTRATLDLAGDGFLQVALPTAAAGGIAMSGRISADGGSVILSAASAVDAARHIVNLTGMIEARGVSGTNGAVTLTGGDIRLTGATIDVSGAGGGGEVRIGGDRQGRGALVHAQTVSVDAATRIRADAIGSGDGGNVTIWSDRTTHFAGTISAKGAGAGRGGEAEVSSAGRLDYRGTAELTGSAFGTLLLDPYNITISGGADSNQSGFTATGADSVINAATLTDALKLANVTVSTGAAGSAGAQAGDITLAAPLRWTSSATLTLQAASDIALNGAIDAAAGGLTLDAGGAITDSADLSVARFHLTAGDWSQVAAALPAFAAGDFSVATDGASFLRATGGAGTAADPYLLTDIYGVQGINGFLTSSFALDADIDAADTASWNGGAGFVPLGTDGESNRLNGNTGFTGQFDGQEHVISGLTINRPSAYFVGLFGWQGGGAITRIGLVGGSITGKNSVGGLLGYQIGGSISQSYVTGSVAGSSNVGGLVGKQTDGSIGQSYATGSVRGNSSVGGLVGSKDYGSLSQSYATGAASGHNSVGGLIGYLAGGNISQSYATGAVSGTANVGGLVGYQVAGDIGQSHATGIVTGTNNVGGLLGWMYGGGISDSYWDSYSTGQSAGFGSQGGTVVNVSAVTSDPAQSGAVSYAFAKGAYAGFDFAAGPVTSAETAGWVWAGSGTRPFLAWEVPTVPVGGGSAVIRNSHQLQLINAGNLGGNYVLANNIDLTADLAAVGGMWSSAGFVPLGTDGDGTPIDGGSGFTGNFDGQGHVIAGLAIDRPTTKSVGLFGYQGGGTIARIGLVGASVIGGDDVGGLVGQQVDASIDQSYVTGSVTGGSYVGGLAGYQYGGSISHSHATGSVRGNGRVGGLVGLQDGGSSVSQSYATGSVTGSVTGVAYYTGGLVGRQVGSSVSQSYATGSVSGLDFVGGLVGALYGGDISQSYATGSVSGHDFVGGLVARQGGGGNISQSYATGSVSSSGASFGGLVGYQFNGSATNSYWDSYTTGQSAGVGVQSGTVTNLSAVTSDPAQSGAANYAFNPDVYAGFTFAATPVTTAGAAGWVRAGSGTRPFLAWEVPTAPVGGGPAVIRNSHQLQLINAGDLNGNYVLANDIDLTADLAAVGGKYPGMWSEAGFVPLGTDGRGIVLNVGNGGIGDPGFTGNFDGQGHVIAGLVINRPSVDYAALFGWQGGGSISRIGLVGGSVSGGDRVGALVGAHLSGSIDQSYATGSVSGDTEVGGLVGAQFGGSVFRSYATGSVNGYSRIGGLIGYQDDGSLAQSYATGSVNGHVAVGGLTGFLRSGSSSIARSYATGDVNGVTRVGGLVGDHLYGSIDQSYATGSVIGTYGVGGLVGDHADGSVARSYWNTTTTGQAYASGGGDIPGATGLTTAQMQDLSSFATTYAGWDFTSVWSPPNQVGQNGGSATAYYPQLYALSPVVAVAPNTSAPYGTTPIAQYYGLRAGDFITAPATITGASAASDVGSYALTASGASASDPAYRFVYLPTVLTVTPAPLTIAANDLSRVYDGTAFTGNGVTYAGFVGGQDASVLDGSLIYGGDAKDVIDAGSYTIAVSGLSSGNYAITYIDGALTIARRTVEVTANALSRIYGDANPALTYRVGGLGLVGGDTLSGALATDATAASDVGTYAITQGNLGSNNYDIVQFTGANLSVTPADLSVMYQATPVSSIYGDTPLLGGTVNAAGLKNGDTLAAVTSGTTAWASAAGATSDVGSYGVTGSGLAAASANYHFSFVQGAGNATALTITPRALTVTADALSRIYGDSNPSLTYTVGGLGLVNGDGLPGALATSATAASDVGSYAITLGNLKASDNYALSYQGATLTIDPADLTLTYRATPVSSVYGDTPLLTGTVSAVGLKNGDALTAVTSGMAAWSSADDATSNIGTYGVTGSGLAGGSGNYSFTFVEDAANATALAITPRALTVTADALSRIYADANPALTYRVGGRGLVNGDALTGTLATPATRSSVPGHYALGRGTLTASANYSLQFVPGVLTVLDVEPVPSATIASTLARDAFAAITNPLAGIDNIAPIAGLLPSPGNGLPGQTEITASSQASATIYCLRELPCPMQKIAPR